MKKIVSLILTIAMLCGMLVTVTAAEDAQAVQSRETQILQGLGLLKYVKTLPNGEDKVTKSQFIAMVMYMLDKECDSITSADVPFTDVTEKTAGYKYITGAYSLGIIQGYRGKFYPDSNITAAQAARIFVDILGADRFAQQKGGYPTGYMRMASELDITKGMSIKENQEITFDEASKMFYNALKANVYKMYINGSTNGVAESSQTLLEYQLGIKTDKGILTANKYTSLTTVDGTGDDGRVEIEDYSGYIYKTYLPEQYIGYSVEYFYDEETDDIFFIIPTEKNTVISLTDSEIDKFNFSDRKLAYTPDGKSGKRYAKIPSSATVIVNGKNKLEYTADDLAPVNGDVKLIDNNGDGYIEVVVVNEYETYFVGGISQDDKKIVDYYKSTDENGQTVIKQLDLSDDDGEEILIVDQNSQTLAFSDIQKYDVLTVIATADRQLIRCIVVRNSVGGKVTTVKNSDKASSYIKFSDGNEYKIAPEAYADMTDIFNTGKEGTLYLNEDGKAIAFIVGNTDTKYGFYVKAFKEAGGKNYVKLLDVEGKMHEYETVKNFKVDGVKTDAENMPIVSQIVIYATDGEKIRSIDTEAITSAEKGDSLNSIYGSNFITHSYYPAFNSFRGKLYVSAKTPIFMCPTDPTGMSDSDYAVKTISALEKVDYDFKGYNTSKKSLEPDVVHINMKGSTMTSLSKSASKAALITNIETGINSDDEIVEYITFANDETTQYEVKYNGDGTELKAKVEGLDIGDLVFYNLDSQNRIVNIDYLIKYDKTVNDSSEISAIMQTSQNWWSSQPEQYLTYVFNINEDRFGLTASKPISAAIPEDLLMYSKAGDIKVYLVDTDASKPDGRVSVVDWSYIQDYMGYGTADYVYARMSDTKIGMVVIFR